MNGNLSPEKPGRARPQTAGPSGRFGPYRPLFCRNGKTSVQGHQGGGADFSARTAVSLIYLKHNISVAGRYGEDKDQSKGIAC